MKKLTAILSCLLMMISAVQIPQNASAVYDKTVTFANFDRSINGGEPIRGADISSIIALEESGVVFHNDTDYEEDDIFRILADHGVNYIRVRVWNQPSDDNGNSYGGGHNDVDTACEIGRRASQYGMKLLVDFHYSDFWADPEKQRTPKAWANYTSDEKGSAIYYYTLESLQKIRDAGADIGMVQVGNETNGVMCGEDDMYTICKMMKAGCNAVEDFDSSILKVLHFADPSSGLYPWYAKVLNECEVNYDVFATSYYPYWHGTTDNLTSVLKNIADTYDKYVMVAETAYPYTDEDGDKFANVISSTSSGSTFRYEISVDGQAECFTDVFQAVANVGTKGIGAFYWEPAWIGDYNASWTEQKERWAKHGSGWATSYASEYGEDVSEAGGSSYDNQALFNFWGYPLDSLNVYSRIYPQQYVYDDADSVTLASGMYEIKNQNSGYYLSYDENGNIIQSESPVQWHLVNQAGSYTLMTVNNQYLTIVSDASDGKNAVRLGDSAQEFQIAKNQNQTYLFMTDEKTCLDIFDGSTWAGSWATYGKALRSESQQFVLNCISEDVIETEPETKPEKHIKGDVHHDNDINLTDVVLLHKYLINQASLSQEQAESADMNQDGVINIYDWILLKKQIFSRR
ncbi:MAG: glycosyl hydrolase 53 family protein [Oscillospiraceae bacterium]|nr:glycosyl hydrolase 53 family protein [Oscillospiraceae bacterium]